MVRYYLLSLTVLAACHLAYCTDYILELLEGSRPAEGLVVMHYNNETGIICDDFFRSYEAVVVCRELNFSGVLDFASDAESAIELVWLDNLHCQSNETSVLQCQHLPLGQNNCDGTREGVFLRCDTSVPEQGEGAVRLVGGSGPSNGYLEIFHEGIWGSVCNSNGGWSAEESAVVCRQLGMGFNGSEVNMSELRIEYDENNIIWLHSVDCVGCERTLESCSHPGWFSHSIEQCSHRQDVTISCQAVPLDSTMATDCTQYITTTTRSLEETISPEKTLDVTVTPSEEAILHEPLDNITVTPSEETILHEPLDNITVTPSEETILHEPLDNITTTVLPMSNKSSRTNKASILAGAVLGSAILVGGVLVAILLLAWHWKQRRTKELTPCPTNEDDNAIILEEHPSKD